METLRHVFAAFDIFVVLINAFPAIFQPLAHGFQTLFMTLFTSLKHLVSLYPGLISGTIFMSLVYLVINALSRLRKVRT